MTIRLTQESRGALSRAKLFLEKAKACPVDAQVDFEALLEAAIVFARAALHRLQTRYRKHPEWKAWWNGLEGDPAVEFFRCQRNLILKEAPPKLGQKIFAASIGTAEPSHSPAWASELYYFDDAHVSATTTVERYLNDLEEWLAEGERRFSPGAT